MWIAERNEINLLPYLRIYQSAGEVLVTEPGNHIHLCCTTGRNERWDTLACKNHVESRNFHTVSAIGLFVCNELSWTIFCQPKVKFVDH